MTTRENYEAYLAEREMHSKDKLHFLWKEQYKHYMKPFRMFGNLYYVGCDWVCMHLIDTGDGLLLFDAGNIGREALLIQAIWEMGFNPKDVKWLVLSHGHLDHFGAVNLFRELFGTKIYMGAPDAKMFREHPELSLIHEASDYMADLFVPDVEINDGDVIRFGNTEVLFRSAAGHTDGCLAAFFDVTDGEKVLRAGYYGGYGSNTLQKQYLLDMGDETFSRRQIYIDSIDAVIDEKVDIFLANHTNNMDVLGKRAKMIENPDENPFINPDDWRTYLQDRKEMMQRLMADPAQN